MRPDVGASLERQLDAIGDAVLADVRWRMQRELLALVGVATLAGTYGTRWLIVGPVGLDPWLAPVAVGLAFAPVGVLTARLERPAWRLVCAVRGHLWRPINPLLPDGRSNLVCRRCRGFARGGSPRRVEIPWPTSGAPAPVVLCWPGEALAFVVIGPDGRAYPAG